MTGVQRREQLLAVGRTAFAEMGYGATSIEEVADRAGVSKPIVYSHFGGKEGLYAVIVDREVAELVGRITTALTAEHPRAAVQQAAQGFLGYIEDNPEGFRILVRDAPVGMTSGTLASVMGDLATDVEGLLAQHFKEFGYDEKLAPLYARSLIGMVAMVGEWWLEARTPSRDVVAAHVVNLAWNGLKDLEKTPRPLKAL